uniref:Uncharacterized protein n=1 Tax=viral metagenome TaxID=1070528 RepID=A0A6C0D9J0_9ZZZZ
MNNYIKKNTEGLNKHEIKHDKYSGIFSDQDGNPDFKGLGPFLKGMLYLFIFSIIIIENNNNYYLLILLFLFFVGRIMTAVRFYYIETLDANGADNYFVRMNAVEHYVEGFIALFVMLYLSLNKTFAKKK